MEWLSQSPTDPAFVQDPYPFYDRLRALGPLVGWTEYGLPMAAGYDVVNAVLRDRRFGRENPSPPPRPAHQAGFWAVEDHSMLELEPPRHTRLRASVLRAFTSRRIAEMEEQITALAQDLVAAFPSDRSFDLLDTFARPLPVRIIARLLGVPESDAPRLLAWSNAMVGMYQAGRTEAQERAAAKAATAFSAYLADIFRAPVPGSLIADLLDLAGQDRLSAPEVTATCILLLNAGHEATVHTLGNGVAGLLSAGLWHAPMTPALTEEVLRHDPPLHLFLRYATEDLDLHGHSFRRGEQIGLLLAGANRDPAAFAMPEKLLPDRFPAAPTPLSFGAGRHFCLGAPLARSEIQIGLAVLSETCPTLRLTNRPTFADIYHFHGLSALKVTLT